MVVRLPLEVELYRNHKHSKLGQKLQNEINQHDDSYLATAQSLIEASMLAIAEQASDDGQLDATALKGEAAEMLQLFLDHQETWQEVCLVLEMDEQHAVTLVLTRPMALKLTPHLGQLVLNGAYSRSRSTTVDLDRFLSAFGNECAVYIGGPDGQDQPAELIHGIKDLPGATLVAPGIYRGGLQAAVDGVLKGVYQPLDFRFFLGRHDYEETMLHVAVVLGKLQPVACSRTLALKQCLSLPKPLWHEVLELCGDELAEISKFESQKRDDLNFQIIDDDDEDDDEIEDELDELDRFDDDDEDYYLN